MHTPTLAGVYFALTCWLLAASTLSLVVSIWRGFRASNVLFAGQLTATALQALFVGTALLAGMNGAFDDWYLGRSISQVLALATAALHLHLALFHSKVHRAPLYISLCYGAAASFAYLILRRPWLDLEHSAVVATSTLGVSLLRAQAPLAESAYSFLIAIPLAHFASTLLFARAYLLGRRTGLVMFVGGGLLTLAAINDSLCIASMVRSVPVLPIGMVLFSTALGVTLMRNYQLVQLKLQHRNEQLSQRVQQLRSTQQKLSEVQSELGRKEQLAEIGEMAAVIAHEVRNPLAVIANAVASLRREGLCRRDHDTLLSILDEENSRLNRLVSDLLTYARPISLQRQLVVLRDLTQRAVAMAQTSAVEVVHDSNSAQGQIWGDIDLLRQVLDNLVENAIQATGSDGRVTVSVGASDRGAQRGYEVRVSDDGEGMDTQVRTRAKDPFFTTRPSGTGLGLAIVTRIVEVHGGDVTFESRRGEGTTVRVFLPVASEDSTERNRTPESSASADRTTSPSLKAFVEG